jgi:hypothetical protein
VEVTVECGDVLDGELVCEVVAETVGEMVGELGEPPVVVQPEAIIATAPSSTPTNRMLHILPAGHEQAPCRAMDARNTALGSVLGPTKTCRPVGAAHWNEGGSAR